MAKPELGTKQNCASCGAKFYDLNRASAPCPKCGTVYTAPETAAPAEKAKPKAEAKPEKDLKKTAAAPGTEASEEEEIPDIDVGEIDTDIEEADDDAFLDEDDDNSDMTNIGIEVVSEQDDDA